jgi:predicted RNA binding protein YcfA (HicA-like mRNA interferase family)
VSLRNHDWREVAKALARLGFVVKRQSGSHIILEHADGRWTVIPRHDPIKQATLKSIIDDAGLTVEKFLELL